MRTGARPRRRSARQSRSAFGIRKPKQIAGRAGRPATSVVAVSTSVAQRSPVIAIQVHATRSPKRSAAARKSAKKRMSGGPRFALALDGSPGTRNAIDTSSKMPGCSETT